MARGGSTKTELLKQNCNIRFVAVGRSADNIDGVKAEIPKTPAEWTFAKETEFAKQLGRLRIWRDQHGGQWVQASTGTWRTTVIARWMKRWGVTEGTWTTGSKQPLPSTLLVADPINPYEVHGTREAERKMLHTYPVMVSTPLGLSEIYVGGGTERFVPEKWVAPVRLFWPDAIFMFDDNHRLVAYVPELPLEGFTPITAVLATGELSHAR